MSFTFKPDPTIFSTTTFDLDRLRSRLFECACMFSGLRITLVDDRSQTTTTFHFPDGIRRMLDDIPPNGPRLYSQVIRLSHKNSDLHYEIAISHSTQDEE